VTFADIGGEFGACPPDDTADGNDKFHALNCFSDMTTMGSPGYPCEASPPQAYNVDAGGQFGACCPDGVCDGNDAFHALDAFTGVNPCMCPPNFVCPCDRPTEPPGNPVLCPPGAMPESLVAGVRVAGLASVRLEALKTTIRPGELVEVNVILENGIDGLRGYQLNVQSGGG
jgi:hypothetical protein